MNALVLGIGNLLLRDEGAGVRVVEEFERRFRAPPSVQVLDGGTSGIELLQHMGGRDALILVDVVRSGTPSGTITRFEGEAVPTLFQKKISPHQLGISDLLATLRLTDAMPGKVILLGVEPRCIETGLELTPELARTIGPLADMVADELRGLGVRVDAREECGSSASLAGAKSGEGGK